MQGNGGMMAAGTAIDLAVHTIMSGPAAGAIAAAQIGVQAGHPNLVACDMGGTAHSYMWKPGPFPIYPGGGPSLTV